MGSITRLVARRPLASFLWIAIGGYFAIVVVQPLVDVEIWFDLPLFGVLGSALAGAAAFLVTAAADGRAGVVDLLRRTFRWRVPVRWYLLALFAVPLAIVALAVAIWGSEAVEAPADGWLHVLGVVLGVFVFQFLLFQLGEEVAWTGFFQDRLRDRYTPLKLSAVVAFFWALWHLPDFFAEEGWGLEQFVVVFVFFAIELVLLFFARVLIVWLYERAGRSVFLVVVFHASFDASISELSRELIPASDAVRFVLVNAVVVLAAAALIVATRGRLAGRPEELPRAVTA